AHPHTSIVERYRTISLRQRRACAMPHNRRIAEAHDQQDRFSLALLVPINLCPLIFDKWHASPLIDLTSPRLKLFQNLSANSTPGDEIDCKAPKPMTTLVMRARHRCQPGTSMLFGS